MMTLNSLRYELHKVQGVIGLSQWRKIMAEVDAAEDRIKELESVQTPRPMDDAPMRGKILVEHKDGQRIRLRLRMGSDRTQMTGWLPLPKNPTT